MHNLVCVPEKFVRVATDGLKKLIKDYSDNSVRCRSDDLFGDSRRCGRTRETLMNISDVMDLSDERVKYHDPNSTVFWVICFSLIFLAIGLIVGSCLAICSNRSENKSNFELESYKTGSGRGDLMDDGH